MRVRSIGMAAVFCVSLGLAAGCASTSAPHAGAVQGASESGRAAAADTVRDEKFIKDREAILAMAGDYRVEFDFMETVAYSPGYEPKERKLSAGYEVVRVIEDRGDFISLQHILVVGGDEKFPIKHWRQDWVYEPEEVLTFIGGNAWRMRPVPEEQRTGNWAQNVYQVDDSPRYGAVAAWRHENGLAQWESAREWRPLPRRDMTTRDDYHAVNAINRHALTPTGWVHEQDNEKTVLLGERRVLVREIAVNTYDKTSDFDVSVATDYWNATQDYWAHVRGFWSELESEGQGFALTVQGEPEAVYDPLLAYADAIAEGSIALEEAVAKARQVIAEHTTTSVGELEARLKPSQPDQSAGG